jgi:thiamine-phosphate pyrophosphorylase
MNRRQSLPQQWLILDGSLGEDALSRLPRGSGVLVLGSLGGARLRRLGRIARRGQLTVILEGRGSAARIHDQRELTRALLRRSPLILVSPIHPTASHPEWTPFPRMRAAALARLTGRRAVALGGMDAKRYAKIAQLGFIGWAGISAFRT